MAITTSSTLTQEFVDALSAEMLLQPDAQYVFAMLAGAARAGAMGIPELMGAAGVPANMQQAMGNGLGTLQLMDEKFMAIGRDFAKVVSEPTTPGKVILIDQPRYLTAGLMTETSRRLTEGTPITANPLAATMGQVSVTIREYGGPHDSAAVAPIAITDFLKRRAKHDLVQYVGLLLRRDRNRWFDSVVAETLSGTTKVTYGLDKPSEDNMAGGDQMREPILGIVQRKLQERNIPTFSNGQYMLIITPRQHETLKNDSDFREGARYFAQEGPLFSGHVGNWAGFMIAVSNNLPAINVGPGDGAPGSQGLAFGPGAFGWAIGMDAEARRSKDDDFGREDRVVWVSHEGFKLLDENFVEKVVTFY